MLYPPFPNGSPHAPLPFPTSPIHTISTSGRSLCPPSLPPAMTRTRLQRLGRPRTSVLGRSPPSPEGCVAACEAVAWAGNQASGAGKRMFSTCIRRLRYYCSRWKQVRGFICDSPGSPNPQWCICMYQTDTISGSSPMGKHRLFFSNVRYPKSSIGGGGAVCN